MLGELGTPIPISKAIRSDHMITKKLVPLGYGSEAFCLDNRVEAISLTPLRSDSFYIYSRICKCPLWNYTAQTFVFSG